MNYYVYSHTRLDINEIFYIGIGRTYSMNNLSRAHTKSKRSIEWQETVTSCNNNYKVDILFTYDNIEECCLKEVELIEFYGRKHLNKGNLVNKSPGGHKWKDAIKVYQYDLDGNYIAEWISPKAAATVLNIEYTSIYESCRLNYKVGNFQFRSYKTFKIEPWKHKQAKNIFCFNQLGEFICEFESIGKAAKHFNTYHQEICAVLERKRHSVKNHIFSYDRHKCFIRRIIYQYDINNQLLAKYVSLPDVVKKLNLKSHNSIDNALKGILQTQAYGFIWKELTNQEIYVA